MKFVKSIPVIVFVCIVWLPIQSFACACCAERGTYSLTTKKPSGYELDEIKKLGIATTEIFSDAGYPETIKGIAPLGESFTASCLWQNNNWKFDFKDDKNKSGTLNLILPPKMTDFRADIHTTDDVPDVTLYKELRFNFQVKNGTGIFRQGILPATNYALVLQGRGNNCLNAQDFTHWRLEIAGKKAAYAFFGKLKVL